jgi:hypothetical protein
MTFCVIFGNNKLENVPALLKNPQTDRQLGPSANGHEPFLIVDHKGYDKLAASGRVNGSTICSGPINFPETSAQLVSDSASLSMFSRGEEHGIV